ncbi:MAG: FecR domain-containing protein [Rhodocyclaceae bacterium]|nr:FecR domain-containing protein [Rhodocyclaceae bacterium]MBX3670540.1 FecR domain-containing protein [Rhodocyclaceae bacterium]
MELEKRSAAKAGTVLGRSLVCLALVGCCLSAWAADDTVGSIVFSQGVTTSQRGETPARLVGKGEALSAGDVISTGSSSVAILELQDGSRMTLRPGTRFAVEGLNTEQGKESAVVRLFRGGLRALTGFISKRSPDAFKVRTSTATIGIRGTDFDARLCEAECATEAARLGQAQATTAQVAARALAVQGTVVARGAGGEVRKISDGGPVYAGDTVETDARGQAVLAFRDDTRFTLQGGTRFAVQNYHYDAERGAGNALFRLLKGGLRAFTGLIGKRDPGNFRIGTAVATIGIRGTGMDMNCSGACAGEPGGEGLGLLVGTWQGTVEVSTETGSQLVNVSEVALVVSRDQLPRLLQSLPAVLRNIQAPRPDRVPVNIEQLFGSGGSGDDQPGLYVWVRDGHVTVDQDGQHLDLGRDESLFAGGGQMSRLALTPVFMQLDQIPKPGDVQQGGSILPMLRNNSGQLQGGECQF